MGIGSLRGSRENIKLEINGIRNGCDRTFREAQMPKYRKNCLSDHKAFESFHCEALSSFKDEKKQLADAYLQVCRRHESEGTRLHSDRNHLEADLVSCRSRFQEACRQKEHGILVKKDDFAASWEKMAEAAEQKGVNFIEIADDA